MVPGSMTGSPYSNSLLSKVLTRLSSYGLAGAMDFLGGYSTDGGSELSFIKDPDAYTEICSFCFMARRGFSSLTGEVGLGDCFTGDSLLIFSSYRARDVCISSSLKGKDSYLMFESRLT